MKTNHVSIVGPNVTELFYQIILISSAVHDIEKILGRNIELFENILQRYQGQFGLEEIRPV